MNGTDAIAIGAVVCLAIVANSGPLTAAVLMDVMTDDAPVSAEILEAARATYVDRFVHNLPDGYDTVMND